MTENNEKTIIEINGVKLEVDMRYARRIDTFKIGDPVRVLVKQWTDKYEPFYGTIIDFACFKKLPTITIAYLNKSDLNFAYLNEKSTADIEVIPVTLEELKIDRKTIIDGLNDKIRETEEALRKANAVKEIFLRKFGQVFQDLESSTEDKEALVA